FSIEFGRKTTNIAYSICRTTRPLYRRKTYKYRRLYTGIGQKACFGQFFIAWISFKKTMCVDTAGMHNTFWNSLMVKMGNFFPKNKIFDQGRPANACLETVLVIGNFNPLIGGECLLGRITAICVELLTFFIGILFV